MAGAQGKYRWPSAGKGERRGTRAGRAHTPSTTTRGHDRGQRRGKDGGDPAGTTTAVTTAVVLWGPYRHVALGAGPPRHPISGAVEPATCSGTATPAGNAKVEPPSIKYGKGGDPPAQAIPAALEVTWLPQRCGAQTTARFGAPDHGSHTAVAPAKRRAGRFFLVESAEHHAARAYAQGVVAALHPLAQAAGAVRLPPVRTLWAWL